MILVESAAWIEFQRATASPADRRVTQALRADEALATTGVVTLEILAGARDEQHDREPRRLLARCRFLPLEKPPIMKPLPPSIADVAVREPRSGAYPTT